MEKRYQVFISSTFVDLQNARQEVSRALLRSECFPAGMELFPAADDEQFEIIKSYIDESDYYLIVSAGRYGSINGKTGLSFTEMEFDYALLKRKPIIALLHKDPHVLPNDQCENTDEGRRALEAFRKKLQFGRMVGFWEDAKDLGREVVHGLHNAKRRNPATGWVRAPEISRTAAGAGSAFTTGPEVDVRVPDVSGQRHGGYTRDQCRGYLGFFYAYRRAFTNPQDIDRSLFEFAWSDERSCMTFTNSQTYPTPGGQELELRVHKGEAFFNSAASLWHLLVTDRGALRLLTLTSIRVDDGAMHGVILSQVRRSHFYQPSVSPIMLQRQAPGATREQLLEAVGVIRPQSPEYAAAARHLMEIERDIGVFALASRIAGTQEAAQQRAEPAPVAPIGETDDGARPPLKH